MQGHLCKQMPICFEDSAGPSPLGVAGSLDEPWLDGLWTWAQSLTSQLCDLGQVPAGPQAHHG